MIKHLKIKNFKSHKSTDLEFSNLNVFCGANGVGKSSAIHALLLLRESFLKNSNFEYLDLKSNPVTIGTAKDALYQYSETNIIAFEILTSLQNLVFSFEAKKDTDLEKTLIYKTQDFIQVFNQKFSIKENIFNKECQFVSASRIGPQSSYKKDDVVVDVYNQISVIEGQAEHFIHFLNKNKDKEVLAQICNDRIKYKDLFNQTTAWEREISEGVNIVVSDLGNLGYELNYQFNTESSHGKTNEFKANNVGFGLTYVMPIIVAILSAQPDSLLLIENPEAHLHPNGQAKLAELICLAAQAGIQMVIETHSDHIINGILVQCKKFEETHRGISKDNVSIYYFGRNETEHCSTASKINIQKGGNIIYPPTGFFDQFSIDRKYLLGF